MDLAIEAEHAGRRERDVEPDLPFRREVPVDPEARDREVVEGGRLVLDHQRQALSRLAAQECRLEVVVIGLHLVRRPAGDRLGPVSRRGTTSRGRSAACSRGRSRRTRRARAAWSFLREAAHVILDSPEHYHVIPHRSPAPQGRARRRATSRRHRRGSAGVADGAQAPVQDARLRGRRRGDAEAQGPRRCHAGRRGQAGGAGRLDRRHGRRPQGTRQQEESDRRRRRGGRDRAAAPRRAARAHRGAARHRRRHRPRAVASPAPQHRARDLGRGGPRSHGRDHRDLPPARVEPTGAPAGRDRAAHVRGPPVARDRRRRAPARRYRAEGRGGIVRGARSPQDPRPHLRAQGGAGRHRRRVEDATGEASGRRRASRWSGTPTRASRR